jgi:hypothetical protein
VIIVSTQSFKDKQVMWELGDFFRSFGIGVYLKNNEGEEQLMTMDERVRDLMVSFTFKITNNGKRMVISTFVINTNFVLIKKCEDLKVIFSDPKSGKVLSEMTFFDPGKVEFPLDFVLLKFLVAHPAYFLLYSALSPEFELDIGFIDELTDRLWKMSPELSEEETKRLCEYVKKYI